MKKRIALTPDKLRVTVPLEQIPYDFSDTIPKNGIRYSPQKRVLEALELGLHISTPGYNIYLAGEPDLGRSYMLLDYLTPHARKASVPPDMIYSNNFKNADAPHLLLLPAGMGNRLNAVITQVLPKIQKEIGLRIERAPFVKKHSLLFNTFQEQREKLFRQINKQAVAQGFNLSVDESGGMTLFPIVEGKRLNEQDFENLGTEQQQQFKRKSDRLLQPMTGLLRKLAKAEQSFLAHERSLERETMGKMLSDIFDPVIKKFLQSYTSPELQTYFTALRLDILENHTLFLPAESQQMSQSSATPPPATLASDGSLPAELANRYALNIFINNEKTTGAPIVFEDHPTLSNLMGSIEREAEMGALITDFSLIRAGAIHRANNGYLVLRASDILHYPAAWEALIRALRSGNSRIEDADEEDTSKAKGLQPDPIPLSLKVILVGAEDLYEGLLMADERFSKLFKIKAHLTEHMPRDKKGIRVYLSHIRRIIDENKLLPFARDALAGLVEYGSLLIEDQHKLSLKFPLIRELMVEASAFASIAKQKFVNEKIIARALDASLFRSNLVEEAYLEDYDRRIIKVVTDGEAIGKVNGLAVSSFGDFEFGLPHQICCTIGAGSGGIIDLERDAQLSGPIHNKAIMILKTYLVSAFAHNKPIILTGSLGFEQNYLGVEGDSASGAELAALLSALARIPLRLSLAFTGAVGQSGEIMAVGSVTRKIEGYFQVCKRHGLTGQQGVLIPKDNIAHLMLHKEVVEAVSKGMFHIYSISHITEALELLSGLPAGKRRKDGTYTPGSLFQLVDTRLRQLAHIATRYGATNKKGA